jgi:hypothetical protein
MTKKKKRTYAEQIEASKKPKPEYYYFGRPTLYKPEYCKMLVEHMAKGYSFKTFAALVPCTETAIEEWVHKYPDFAAAKKQGKALEKAVWEKILMNCAINGKGNITAIIWATKNKFPDEYKERNEAQQINVQANVNNIQIENWSNASEDRLKQLEEKERKISNLKAINATKRLINADK